jgi:hypothetical protein
MKFKIRYRVGGNLREQMILADDLEDAEKIANKKLPKWIDILLVLKKGK